MKQEEVRNPKYLHLYDSVDGEMEAMHRLLEIVRILREECPWDRVQTHDSLKRCMIEEAYEAVEAIQNQDLANLREELGDVLLQVLLNGIIAEEEKEFSLTEICNEESEKMIRRHPHIFGEDSLKAIDKVLKKWENIKSKEHGDSLLTDRLTGVPKALPALIRAEKVQKRTEEIGFPLDGAKMKPDINGVVSVERGMDTEYEVVSAKRKLFSSEKDLGNLLFTIVNEARLEGYHPEEALNGAIDAFANKLHEAEVVTAESGGDFQSITLEELFDL